MNMTKKQQISLKCQGRPYKVQNFDLQLKIFKTDL